MTFSYEKLWEILDEREMRKGDLQKVTGISSATLAKLSKNENINMRTLEKICIALNCDVGDIINCRYSEGDK